MANKYCPNCGYSNEPDRGACLMCHALLPVAAVGEPQRSDVAEAAGAPRGIEAMAAVVVEAAEGLSGGITTGLLPAEVAAEEYVMEALEGPGSAELAEEVVQAQEPVPAEERAEAEGPEEEYIPPPPPPGALDLEEEAFPVTTALEAEQAEAAAEAPPAPPPPEEIVDLDEVAEEAAPAEEPAAEAEEKEGPRDEWAISRE